MAFVHLHCHTDASHDGIGALEDLVKRAKELGMPALAMTDHGTLANAVTFTKLCHQYGIKPILGVEAYVLVGDNQIAHQTILASGQTGWENLVKLQNEAHRDQFITTAGRTRAYLTVEQILEHNAGLFVLSGCIQSMFHITTRFEAESLALRYKDTFGDRFFMEKMPIGHEGGWHVPEGIAEKFDIQTVITNDAHFINRHDAKVHEIMMTGGSYDNRDLWLKSEKEMKAACAERRIEWNNTAELIAMSIEEVDLERAPKLPDIPEADAWLTKRVFEDKTTSEEEKERLDFELEVIIGMEFSAYFYILHDIITWAKKRGIKVGPGRGSGAGSLVLYRLGITEVDPLEYGLSFERFLNPERKGFPDVDVDIESERRGEVLDYCHERWGTIGISTYARYQHSSLVRELGRKLRLDQTAITEASEHGDESAAFKKLLSNPEFGQCYRTCLGQIRHKGTHAGGVVITDAIIPVERTKDGNELLAAWAESGAHKELSYAGLVKFDLLGLKALTVLRRIEDVVGSSGYVLDDKPTLNLFKRGHLTGIFQFSGSPGIVQLIKSIKPSSINDVIAATALFRPGALDAGTAMKYPSYKKAPRRHVPSIDKILSETYGVVVYQEQFMQIFAEVTGGTLADADLARRTITVSSIGDPHWEMEMQKLKVRFLEGAKRIGWNEGEASRFWTGDIVSHSRYSFNKSHSVAYSLISWQLAYYKANYPAQFFQAALNVDASSTFRLLTDAIRSGLKVVPPHVNVSSNEWMQRDGKLFMPFSQLRGISPNKAALIILERERGEFASIPDFMGRVPKGNCNAAVRKGLYALGGFDGLAGSWEDLEIKTAPEYSNSLEAQRAHIIGAVIPNEKMLDAVEMKTSKVRGIVLEINRKKSKKGKFYYDIRLYPENNIRVGSEHADRLKIGTVVSFKRSRFGWASQLKSKDFV